MSSTISQTLSNLTTPSAGASVGVSHFYLQPTDRTFKWGIISTGKIAEDFATAMKHTKSAQLWAIGSRNKRTATEFGAKFSVPESRCYDSYEQLAQDPSVEIIYIATPHNYHYECVKLCLINHKHVVCEKPLTQCAAHTKELVQLAATSGVYFSEGIWTRHDAYMRFVRQLLFEEKKLGDVYHVEASLGMDAKTHPEVQDRLYLKEYAGGVTLDMGLYPVQLASMVYNYQGSKLPSKLHAVGELVDTGVDEQVAVSCRYGPNQFVTWHVNSKQAPSCEAWIVGQKGSLKLAKPFNASDGVAFISPEGKEEHWQFPVPYNNEKYNYPNGGWFSQQILHTQHNIEAGKHESEEIPHRESVAIAEVLDWVRREIGVSYPEEKNDFSKAGAKHVLSVPEHYVKKGNEDIKL